MMLGARNGAWAKSGSPTPAAYGGLCFTAEADNSSVQLTAVGSAPAVTLVKSFDGVNWEDYTVGEVIDLPSTGDFVYLAAGEGGNETFGSSSSVYHKFVINGLVAASGDITSLRRLDLEQTTLAKYCYTRMFRDCTGLTSAPELPATTLAIFCYDSMFRDCTGLTSAPELPATTLKAQCYNSMFKYCKNISIIKIHFTSWDMSTFTEKTNGWVSGVASTGTFYKPSSLPEEYGISKIPTGWTVVNID